MRIAVIYFGMVRERVKSLGSIWANLIDPNRRSGIDLMAIASLNLVDIVQNPRTNELDIILNKDDIFQLDADLYILRKQMDEEITDQLSLAKTRDDVYSDGWRSIRNLLHQMASLHRAWRAMELLGYNRFDAYLFVRADLRLLDQVDLSRLYQNLSSDKSILVPAWHSWGGLNDRLALAAPEAAACYALRLDSITTYCKNHALHSETYLAWSLAQKGCTVGELPVRASRVRSSGHINDEDFSDARLHLPRHPVGFDFSPGHPLKLSI